MLGPSTASTPEIVDLVHNLILGDPQILTRRIAEALEISREFNGFIIHKESKISEKWVLKCLNV